MRERGGRARREDRGRGKGQCVRRRQGEQRAACAVASIGAKRGRPTFARLRARSHARSPLSCMETVDGRLATGLSGVVNPALWIFSRPPRGRYRVRADFLDES